MKPSNYAITEWSEKTLFTRQETVHILGIGLSMFDFFVSCSEFPRTIVHKRVFVRSKGLEKFIATFRTSIFGGRK